MVTSKYRHYNYADLIIAHVHAHAHEWALRYLNHYLIEFKVTHFKTSLDVFEVFFNDIILL